MDPRPALVEAARDVESWRVDADGGGLAVQRCQQAGLFLEKEKDEERKR